MRKLLLLAVLGLCAIGALQGQDKKQESKSLRYNSLADGYIANRPYTWWRLNDPGEKMAYDAMSRHDGTRHMQGDTFDGKESRIDLGFVEVESDQMSLLAWFRADDFATEDARIISKATGINDQDHLWMLSTIKDKSQMRLRCRLKLDGKTHMLIANKGKLKAGEWVFAAVVYDGKRIRLYQNGDLVGQMKANGKISTNTHARAWIGSNPDKTGSKPFHGAIKEVALFKNAIPQKSIKAIFATESETLLAQVDHDEIDHSQAKPKTDPKASPSDIVITPEDNEERDAPSEDKPKTGSPISPSDIVVDPQMEPAPGVNPSAIDPVIVGEIYPAQVASALDCQQMIPACIAATDSPPICQPRQGLLKRLVCKLKARRAARRNARCCPCN